MYMHLWWVTSLAVKRGRFEISAATTKEDVTSMVASWAWWSISQAHINRVNRASILIQMKIIELCLGVQLVCLFNLQCETMIQKLAIYSHVFPVGCSQQAVVWHWFEMICTPRKIASPWRDVVDIPVRKGDPNERDNTCVGNPGAVPAKAHVENTSSNDLAHSFCPIVFCKQGW